MKYGDTVITAKNIIIATGSVPFVPKGVEVDGKCFTPTILLLSIDCFDIYSIMLEIVVLIETRDAFQNVIQTWELLT